MLGELSFLPTLGTLQMVFCSSFAQFAFKALTQQVYIIACVGLMKLNASILHELLSLSFGWTRHQGFRNLESSC
jgi:hypothetical protein